ncbi:MAG: pyruvate kinase [Spirochaetota bacterium]|nr:MAG: pyruvate kinase [Spirochaetota bacterium]
MISKITYLKSTKIVCTIGPKSQDEKTIKLMAETGMDVVRMNLSHGSHDFHKKTVNIVRKISKELGSYIGILLDLQGPKIRTRKLMKEPLVLNKDQEIILSIEDVPGDWNVLSVNYEKLPEEVQIGHTILLDDGNIKLEVIDKDVKRVMCRVVDGGIIRSYRGINLPDTKISAPSLTKKDIGDLDFGLKNGVDFIALSFVRNKDDILNLKKKIKNKGKNTPVIAKIEKPEAIENIDDIISCADAIMIARGDLGAETSPQDVPVLQKLIIRKCNHEGKPVITATQMLESMLTHPRPTRAEASDVANAIFDGTDCVMLSGESALGEYPVRAVKVMAEITRRAEVAMISGGLYHPSQSIAQPKEDELDEAVSYHACKITDLVHPKFIIAFTLSGNTATLLSKYRPSVPIIAMSPNENTLRQLSLFWGVYGIHIDMVKSTEGLLDRAERTMVKKGLCKEGDNVVFVGGVPVLSGAATNMLKVHTLRIGVKNL